MTQFLNNVADKFGSQTAGAAEYFFALMSLPVPDQGEYLAATQGFLVFLNMSGTVIRIEDNGVDFPYNMDGRADHPLVLQPLKSLAVDNNLIEICPGVPLGASDADARALNEQLSEDGFKCDDCRGPNVGILNLPDRNVPVIIDRPSVTQMQESLLSTAEILEKHGNPQAQFQPLRDAFNHAFDQPSFKAKQRSLQYAQSLCREFVENKTLVCGWNDVDIHSEHGGIDQKMSAARYTANNYAQRLNR